MRQALFLDRDGVLNERIVDNYVLSVDQLVPLFELVPLLTKAQQHHWLLIIISNQQGVGKGLMTHQDLDHVNQALCAAFETKGIRFDHIECCTDLATEFSRRRKPQPGMLLDTAAALNVSLPSSWFIGDSLSDAHAGRAAGCRTILVGEFDDIHADIVVPDLGSVPTSILDEQS
jgi:D-glycero-D-manno-heptose 1,7-bisphosphate phosphatase